jgi:hypothetical protein
MMITISPPDSVYRFNDKALEGKNRRVHQAILDDDFLVELFNGAALNIFKSET